MFRGGNYTMSHDFRTGSPTAADADRLAVREDIAPTCLPVRQFIRVAADGSGKGWDEWPSRTETQYPAETFRVALRPGSPS